VSAPFSAQTKTHILNRQGRKGSQRKSKAISRNNFNICFPLRTFAPFVMGRMPECRGRMDAHEWPERFSIEYLSIKQVNFGADTYMLRPLLI
jgi:hypothetical protein